MGTSHEDAALLYLRRSLADPAASFRPDQWEAIEALVERDARLLVVQRTGWGKSVVYFMATRLLRDRGAGPTILISPLLALMRNQIVAAERLGIRAATINSNNQTEWDTVLDTLARDEVDILLISPERLSNDDFRTRFLTPVASRIGLLVVDEAHCISDWGHDFRPDYKRITRVLQALPRNVPVVCTTATANDRVVDDIVDQLGSSLEVIRGPLERKSLRLQTTHLPNQAARMAWISDHIPELSGSGIIYTLTIRDAQRLANWLKQCGIDAEAYWGGLDADQRVVLEQQLIDNGMKVLVATTALGMGFDKPDLGFVIHFQRPGSVVHYYQQIGRAGRELERAYVVLLSGSEDQDIIDYFIRSAFPPDGHAEQILDVLLNADDGLSTREIGAHVNISWGQIDKTLRLLASEALSPVSRIGSRWFATSNPYIPDKEKIQRLIELRHVEQEQMASYARDETCLMAFLQRALGDPNSKNCGICEVCRGAPLISEEFSRETAVRAIQYLRRNAQVIKPRIYWPGDAFQQYGWKGTIKPERRFQPGRALCVWGDAGWGNHVRRGKVESGVFDEILVKAAVRLVNEDWNPDPRPAWVTCVPSLEHPDLVPDFARQLANELGLPFQPCIQKMRPTDPQKQMENSYRQARNLDGAFAVERWPGISGPVLLVDDMVDSRWTFTVVSALLLEAGSGPVMPLALAVTARG